MSVYSLIAKVHTQVIGMYFSLLNRLKLKIQKQRRVPVLYQLSTMECGAACLAMILSYYGRKTSVAECRTYCSPGRDGVSARTIAMAARNYGLRVKAYAIEDPADFKYINFPFIAHWEFRHFIIVESWSPKRVQVVDPASGRRQITTEEFDKGFTGVVLLCEPGVNFLTKPKAEASQWISYLQSMLRIRGVRPALILVLCISLALQLLGLALPLFTKILVDSVLPFQITSVMSIIGIGMIVLVATQTLIAYLRSIFLIYLRGKIDSQLMLGFFEHLLALPFEYFQQRSSGDLLLRLNSNSMIRETLTNQTVSMLLDSSFVIVYLCILWLSAPLFAMVVLGIGLIQLSILLLTHRRMYQLTDRDLSAKAEEQSYLVEAMKSMVMLKASGSEARAFDHWSNLFFKQLNVSLKRSHLSALIETSLGMLRIASPLLLLWIGAMQVFDGRMSLGMMLALNSLAISFLTPLTMLVSSGQQLQMVKAQLDRISDVLEAEPEQSLNGNDIYLTDRLTGSIEVRNLSFRYNPESPLVLNNISFNVLPGEKVALVGPTGSGKSTLAMILLGLYKPTSGNIFYDGLPLEKINHQVLRRQFGVVLQESFLFTGSIRQNMSMGNPNMSIEEVIRAAKLANMHKEIEQMPLGYETLVAEGATTLSGGQRQRLSIARAIAHDPVILVLDEATSHLDTKTESEVDANLNSLSCTRIVIAHRLSTIKNADQILVLDNGEIVERGNHDQLMEKGNVYAQLVNSQSNNNQLKTLANDQMDCESLIAFN
jgi:ATP-binding cassette, subfamily B, bacterial